MSIKNTRVLVTGGAGFIGSHVVDGLLKEGVSEVLVLDNLSRGRMENLKAALKTKKVKFIEGDITNLNLLLESFDGVDYVIHEAAIRITQCAEDPRLCQDILVNGTFNVLESCVKNKVKKLVFNSSSSVYGDPSYLPMDEKHPYNNKTAYGAGKIANEQMAKAFRNMYGLNYIALRPFSVYGPRMDIYGAYTEVFIRWFNNIDKREPPVIFGDGKSTSNDYVFVSDVVQATLLALKSDLQEGVYNVGAGLEVSLKKLCQLILDLSGSKLKPTHQEPDAVRIVSKRFADTALAKKDLGFEAKIGLEEGLKSLLSWWKNEKKNKNK